MTKPVVPCAVRTLKLSHFRSHGEFSVSGLPEVVVICGPNGSGKTNILEALSLLSPGAGLRGARMPDMTQRGIPEGRGWTVFAALENGHDGAPFSIATAPDPEKPRRIVRIDEKNAVSQADLARRVSVLWLTPQMDGLFLDAPSQRRRYLDRVVFNLDPAHTGRITRYERAVRERSRLLQEAENGGGKRLDPSWLLALENTMAETGVAIAAARLDALERLSRALAEMTASGCPFPVPDLALSGTVEEDLQTRPALVAEENFRKALVFGREDDARTGGASVGPHKSDLLAFYTKKDGGAGSSQPAAQCSTGEQKAMLISLVLAQAGLLRSVRGMAPILLLDEVAAHLDADRRRALYDLLSLSAGQVWLTGTEEKIFEALAPSARVISTGAGLAQTDGSGFSARQNAQARLA